MLRIFAFLTLFAIGQLSVTAQQQAQNREADDLKLAERSLVASFVVLDSAESKSLCAACRSVIEDEVSLAMTLIAARNSAAWLRSLAELHRFVLDASYGEDFDHYLCLKGAAMERYLLELRPDTLHTQCLKETQEEAKMLGVGVVRVESICASEPVIQARIKQSLDMARHPPKSCEP